MTIRSFYEQILVRVGVHVAVTSYRIDSRRLRRELDDMTAERNELLQQVVQRHDDVDGATEAVRRLRFECDAMADVVKKNNWARAELATVQQQLKEAGISVGPPDGCVEGEGVFLLRGQRDSAQDRAQVANSNLTIAHQCFEAEQKAHVATIEKWEKAERELAEWRLKAIGKKEEQMDWEDVIQLALGGAKRE